MKCGMVLVYNTPTMRKIHIIMAAVALLSFSCASAPAVVVYQPAKLSPMPPAEVTPAPFGTTAAKEAVRKSLADYMDKLRKLNGIYMVQIYPRLSEIAMAGKDGDYKKLGNIFSKTAACNAQWRTACESFLKSAVYLDFYASVIPPSDTKNAIFSLINRGEEFGKETMSYSKALDIYMNSSAEFFYNLKSGNSYDFYVQQNRKYYGHLVSQMPRIGNQFVRAWNSLVPVVAKTKQTLSTPSLSKN